ncbi:hypothetical protein [Thermophilibacter mediterraneus]|uniref:hypothetical protein n=1 Tax=Thermophilibacter mediterraneus TaxID=1871031 RepID=UPI00320AD1B6
MTAAVDQDGYAITDLDNIEFTYNGKAQYVVPTDIETKLGDSVEVDGTDIACNYYKADNAGSSQLADGTKVTLVDKSTIVNAGIYYVGVYKAGATSDAQTIALKFTIVSRSLSDAVIIDGSDKSDTTLEYIGRAMVIGSDYNVKLGDTMLAVGTDYTAAAYVAGGLTATDVEAAGNYVLRLTGVSAAYAGQTVDIPFTVSPIDLSTAKVELDAKTNGIAGTDGMPAHVTKVDGNTVSSDKLGDVDFKLTFISASNGAQAPSTAKGSYVYEVTAVKTDTNEAAENVINSQRITVNRYDATATFTYDGDPITTDMPVKRFNQDYVEVKGGNKSLDFELSYAKQDSNGNWVGVSEADTQWPGLYQVTITAVDDTYSYGGSNTLTFRVNANIVSTSDVYFTYKGDVVNNDTVADIYSGSDLMDNMVVRAFDKDGNEVDPSEYNVVVRNSSNEVVDEIVDEGTYKVSVESKENSMYQISGADNTVTFTVSPVNTAAAGNADIRLAGTMGYGPDADTAYLYTASAVTPSFEYDLNAAMWGYDKSEDWIALPTDAYLVKYEVSVDDNSTTTVSDDTWKKVDECVEPGLYKVTLSDATRNAHYNVSNEYCT